MNILVCNTKGGVGKSFISTQILPLAFYYYNDNKKINIFEVDNNNNTAINTNILNFMNLDTNRIDEILFDTYNNDLINIIDSGGGDDTKAVISNLAENGVEINLFVIPVLKDFEQIKNLQDTINLIKKNYNNYKIVIALNKVVNSGKDEFIYFWGNSEYGIDGYFNEIKDNENIFIIEIKDYNEIDIIKNIYKTTASDALAEYADVLQNEPEYKQKWLKEAKSKFKEINEQRNYFAKKMQKLLLIKRLNNIKNNIQQIFNQIL
jgi:hypothetical protein